ncbi:MAG: response regulator, partial [Chloroflexota bacterium]
MIKVLVADPNPAFAAMIAQVLEETKRFQVTFASTGAEAIGAASRDSFDIVILETSIEDFSLRDAVTVLRRNQPYLPIMVILPFGEQALPDAAKYFDVQGILSKPLYIPDLQKQIESA